MGPSMNRVLRKAIMLRSRLKNKYNNSRTAEQWEAFRRQRNLRVKLFIKERRSFYNRLTISDITDNKIFWKTAKPTFSDEGRSNSKVTLIENDTLILNDKKVAETMNDYFVSINDSLCLEENSEVIISTEDVSDPIERAIIKYSKHPSIRKIRSSVQKMIIFLNSKLYPLNRSILKLKDLILQKQRPLGIYMQNC